MKIICDYCGEPAQLVTGEVIYPHIPKLWYRKFWSCTVCEAYVGTHEGTDKPFGRLAKKDLRLAKSAAHREFDKLWKEGFMRRNEAYTWLSEKLGKHSSKCHIGMFDIEDCDRVVMVCTEYQDIRQSIEWGQ